MRVYEGKAVCKKGWHVPAVSAFGGQRGEGGVHLGLPRKLEQEPSASYTKLREPASTEPREAVSTVVWENAGAVV